MKISLQVPHSTPNVLTWLKLDCISLGAWLRFCHFKFWLKQLYWGTVLFHFTLLDIFSATLGKQINDNLEYCILPCQHSALVHYRTLAESKQKIWDLDIPSDGANIFHPLYSSTALFSLDNSLTSGPHKKLFTWPELGVYLLGQLLVGI